MGIRHPTNKCTPPIDGSIAEQGKSSTLGYDLTCMYDQKSVVVCSMESTPWTSAFDASTGKWLAWELPDKASNRTSIKLTAAWHGLAYGTTSNGPVILDAHTGADRVASAVAAPFLINEYVGIGNSKSGLQAYPTK